jgi:hypothetical protein
LIISIDALKAFDKIQHHFMIKALRKLGIEGMYLNIIKAICDKPIANIKLNGEKAETISSKLKKQDKGAHSSPLLFNIVLEFLARAIKQEEEIKGIQKDKEMFKISLLAHDMILYLKETKNSTQKVLDNKQLQQCSRIENQLTKIKLINIALKKIKYLGVNIMKDVNDLCKENYKLL